MPNFPIPQNVPIERAGWNTDFSGNVQMPNNDRTPVNPIMSGLGQAAQQAQTSLQGAQTASAINDVQMKQRQMQASMLGAIANLPPDQYESAKAHIIPIVNKLNPSYQVDPNIDQQTAAMIARGNVPIEQQPQYALNQSMIPMMQSIRDRLSGGGAQGSNMSGGNSSDANPTNNGQIIDPQTLSLMATIPGMDKSVDTINNIQKTQFESPQGKANSAESVKTAENLADAQKTYSVAESNLPRALERFKQLRLAAPDASYGAGVNEAGDSDGPSGITTKLAQTGVGQYFEPKTAAANQVLAQASKQGILAELGPQLQGLKGNKFLESIANGASGLNMADPPAAKLNAINGLQDQYIANLKSLAAQRRSYGDKDAPTNEQIDKIVSQYNYKPQSAADEVKGKFPQQNNPTQFKTVEDVGAALQAGKITPTAAQAYWSAMGVK